MTDETRWEHLTELFDRLLASADPEAELASEPVPEIRRAAEELWRHHVSAARESFLDAGMEFSVRPVFQPGQVLSNRFRIQHLIGRGGMGEVYLALDQRMNVTVALKTVARLLAPSPSLRRRIVAEVQSARRVTHPNVCRIHELFDDEETIFFTMEYLEGKLLPQTLEESLDRDSARLIVRQLAEGLHAAHRTGVVHGDFKPANVIIVQGEVPRAVIMDFGLACALDRGTSSAERMLSVRAGTAEYMAPELQNGGSPSISSDIYAFGKVLGLLLPNNPVCEWCTRPEPEARPASLNLLLRKLEPGSSRRVWLGSVAVAAAGAVGYGLWHSNPRSVYFPAGARILVNGFRSAAAAFSPARLTRSLLLTALGQSPKLRAIADQDLLSELARLAPGGGLPVAGAVLEQLIVRTRANFLIEADLSRNSDRYSLRLRVMRAGQAQIIVEQAFRDLPGVKAVSREAALWLRRAAGESQASLAVNPVAAETYTSTVPEALEKYYQARDHWAVANRNLAIPPLEEAIRLDPSFAQAHCLLGMLLNTAGENERAYEEVERARHLSSRLPERERVWIETNVSALMEDSTAALRTALDNLTLYPDEPRAYRWLARIMCRAGSAEDAIDNNRKAVELSNGDELQRSELIDNLCEAGQFQQAQTEFENARAAGIRNRWLYGSGGLAYTGLGRYQDALAAYDNEPAGNNRKFDVLRVRVLQGALEESVPIAREALASSESIAEKHQAHEMLCGLYYALDRPAEARAHLPQMVDLPIYPQMARRLDCTSFWAARLGDKPVLAAARERLNAITHRWSSRFTQGLARHAEGLEAWLAGPLVQAESLLLEAAGSAFSPWCLLDLGDLNVALGRPAVAEEYYLRFDHHRGTMLSFWFTGTLVLGWLNRAGAALARKDLAMARAQSQRVLQHWSEANSRLRIVQAAENIDRFTNQTLR